AGAELRHLTLGEAADAREHVGTDVTAGGHGHAGGEVGGDDRGDDLAERDQQHEAAAAPDVSDVGLGDAVVDDVGVDLGQVQRGHHTGELQHDDQEQQPPVSGDVADEDLSQHGRTSLGS